MTPVTPSEPDATLPAADRRPRHRGRGRGRGRNDTAADLERQELLTAAKQVLDRSGWWGFKVESVLKQARLSTRSFYRHFDKKSDLLLALLEDELEGARIRLERAARIGETSHERLHAYIAATIDMAYRIDWATQSSLFASHWREMLPDYKDVLNQITNRMIAPLTEVIVEGVRAGELTSDDPQADATAIYHLVGHFTADQASGGEPMPRSELEGIVLPFIDRAMGIR